MFKRVMSVGEMRELFEGLDDDVVVVSAGVISNVMGGRVSVLREGCEDWEYDMKLLREEGIDLSGERCVVMLHGVDEEGD